MSSSSLLNPFDSAQRWYMRNSIPAKSEASAPPSPACTERKAPEMSSGAERVACNSTCASRSESVSTVVASSRADSPDSSASANSINTSRSPLAVTSCCSGRTSAVRRRNSSTSVCALAGASQNPGAAICTLISSDRFSLPAKSKRVLQMRDPLEQILAPFLQLVFHDPGLSVAWCFAGDPAAPGGSLAQRTGKSVSRGSPGSAMHSTEQTPD